MHELDRFKIALLTLSKAHIELVIMFTNYNKLRDFEHSQNICPFLTKSHQTRLFYFSIAVQKHASEVTDV